jgi:hypothetical protein
MRRSTAATVLAALVALLATGCGTIGGSATGTVPALVRAPPQHAELGWVEHYPTEKPALVFSVSSFTVTQEGWTAGIAVENRSTVGWEVGDPRYEAELQFGVMLFPDDDLDALEQRNRTGTLPAIRHATAYRPALPSVLAPGKTWRGTISAPGALAGGLFVRISFGPFVSVGDPPDGTAPQVVWFTDHAHRLEEVSALPA